MSRPIDVVAFLDGVAGATNDIFRLVGSDMQKEAAEARAAVAELIQAANRAAVAAVRGDDNRPGTIRNADLDALRAAIARVQAVRS